MAGLLNLCGCSSWIVWLIIIGLIICVIYKLFCGNYGGFGGGYGYGFGGGGGGFDPFY